MELRRTPPPQLFAISTAGLAAQTCHICNILRNLVATQTTKMSKLRESSLGQLQRMPAILAAARQISHSIKPPAPNETVIPHPRYPEAHYPPLRGLPLRTAPPFGPLTMPWFALTNQPKMSLADNEWLR